MILRPYSPLTGPLLHPRSATPTRLRACTHLYTPSRRALNTTPSRPQQPQPTHYDVLGVQASATPSELKKRFYVLSKENHPDLHPNSKEHTSRFQQISESYTILGNPTKRRQYDREVMHTRPSQGVQRRGSYAGSRAPTGLSKRQSAFRGPPPSYFGGRKSQSKSQSQSQSTTSSSSEQSSSAYAWGPEPQFQQTTDFNPQPVFRTQTVEDQRRIARNAAAAAAAQAEYEDNGDFWARFVMITVTVMVGVLVGSLVIGTMDSRPRAGGLVKGDGSLRKAAESEKKSSEKAD